MKTKVCNVWFFNLRWKLIRMQFTPVIWLNAFHDYHNRNKSDVHITKETFHSKQTTVHWYKSHSFSAQNSKNQFEILCQWLLRLVQIRNSASNSQSETTTTLTWSETVCDLMAPISVCWCGLKTNIDCRCVNVPVLTWIVIYTTSSVIVFFLFFCLFRSILRCAALYQTLFWIKNSTNTTATVLFWCISACTVQSVYKIAFK